MPDANLPDLPLIEPAQGVSFACAWADSAASGSLELTSTHAVAVRGEARTEMPLASVRGWDVDDGTVTLRSAGGALRIRPPAELLSAVRAALHGRFGEQTDARGGSAR